MYWNLCPRSHQRKPAKWEKTGAPSSASHWVFDKYSLSNITRRSRVCVVFRLQLCKRLLSIAFFNVLESGLKNSMGEESCEEVFHLWLRANTPNDEAVLWPLPFPPPTREQAVSPGEMPCKCHEYSTLSEGLSAQVSSVVKSRIKFSHSFVELVSYAAAWRGSVQQNAVFLFNFWNETFPGCFHT